MQPNPTAPHRPAIASTGDPAVDELVRRMQVLAEQFAGPDGLPNHDLAEQALRDWARMFVLEPQRRPTGVQRDGFTGQMVNLVDSLREDQKLWMRIGDDAAKVTRHMAKFPGSKAWICGSARTPEDSEEFDLVRRVASMLADEGLWVVNGGGPGAMKASTLGAGSRAVQVGIELPFEDPSDDEITVTLAKFFIRKLGMLRHAKVVAAAPGGLVTDEELKEVLTLLQTGKQPAIPVYLFAQPGTEFWSHIDAAFETMIEAGKMSPHDRSLYEIVESPEALQERLRAYYSVFHSYVQIDGGRDPQTGASRSWICLRLQPGTFVGERERAVLHEEFSDIIPSGSVDGTGLTAKELRRIERGLATIPELQRRDAVFAAIARDDWSGVGSFDDRYARVEEALSVRSADPVVGEQLEGWRAEYHQPRLGFWFNDRGYARLGELVRRVNDVGRRLAPAPEYELRYGANGFGR